MSCQIGVKSKFSEENRGKIFFGVALVLVRKKCHSSDGKDCLAFLLTFNSIFCYKYILENLHRRGKEKCIFLWEEMAQTMELGERRMKWRKLDDCPWRKTN